MSFGRSRVRNRTILVAPNTESLLVPAGSYVLVKRFSAKEEKRRVAAAVCDPARLPGDDYGFENHLNYFHRRGNGLPGSVRKGVGGLSQFDAG